MCGYFGFMSTNKIFIRWNLPNSINDNGHIDSIRAMVFHEKFIKPYSDEHIYMYIGLFINQIFLI